jgi:hypothetical protein
MEAKVSVDFVMLRMGDVVIPRLTSSYLRSTIYEANIICLFKMTYILKGICSGDFSLRNSLQIAKIDSEGMQVAGAKGTSL